MISEALIAAAIAGPYFLGAILALGPMMSDERPSPILTGLRWSLLPVALLALY